MRVYGKGPIWLARSKFVFLTSVLLCEMNVLKEVKQVVSRMSPEIFLKFYSFVITDCCFIRMNKTLISKAYISFGRWRICNKNDPKKIMENIPRDYRLSCAMIINYHWLLKLF